MLYVTEILSRSVTELNQREMHSLCAHIFYIYLKWLPWYDFEPSNDVILRYFTEFDTFGGKLRKMFSRNLVFGIYG